MLDYWRQLVEEYFSPSAKKRWCVSLYDKAGLEAMSIFRHATMVCFMLQICSNFHESPPHPECFFALCFLTFWVVFLVDELILFQHI